MEIGIRLKDYDMKILRLVLIMFLTAGFLAGCAQKQITVEPKCLSGINNEFAMKSAERTLVSMNFVIDKLDPNLSIITTKPQRGSQFFEFWAKDNVGGYNKAMSNMDSIRRTVELGFTDKQGEVCITCQVNVQRLSIPEKEIDSTSRAYSIFTSSSQTRQSLNLTNEQREKMAWNDMGRDSQLEASILNRIEKQIIKDRGIKK